MKTFESIPIITISRERGSGGRPIAYLVAKKLKGLWRVYHKDMIDEFAHEPALSPEQIGEVNEHQSTSIKNLLNGVFGKQMLTMSAYHKNILHILATVGARGHAVILGRGANFLFKNALNVRIISKMEDRISSMIKYEHASLKEAKRQIEESDKERDEFATSLFQHDLRKAHHYDLVIRTGKNISIDDAADVIIALAKKKFGV